MGTGVRHAPAQKLLLGVAKGTGYRRALIVQLHGLQREYRALVGQRSRIQKRFRELDMRGFEAHQLAGTEPVVDNLIGHIVSRESAAVDRRRRVVFQVEGKARLPLAGIHVLGIVRSRQARSALGHIRSLAGIDKLEAEGVDLRIGERAEQRGIARSGRHIVLGVVVIRFELEANRAIGRGPLRFAQAAVDAVDQQERAELGMLCIVAYAAVEGVELDLQVIEGSLGPVGMGRSPYLLGNNDAAHQIGAVPGSRLCLGCPVGTHHILLQQRTRQYDRAGAAVLLVLMDRMERQLGYVHMFEKLGRQHHMGGNEALVARALPAIGREERISLGIVIARVVILASAGVLGIAAVGQRMVLGKAARGKNAGLHHGGAVVRQGKQYAAAVLIKGHSFQTALFAPGQSVVQIAIAERVHARLHRTLRIQVGRLHHLRRRGSPVAAVLLLHIDGRNPGGSTGDERRLVLVEARRPVA